MGQRAFAAVGVADHRRRAHRADGALALGDRRDRRCRRRGRHATGAGNVKQLGTAVFTTYLFAFEATAALLVIAVVGAVLLARRERAAPTRRCVVNVPAAWYLVSPPSCSGSAPSGCSTRRSALIMFMCIELMLNAVNLTFVTFSRTLSDIGGQAIVFFVMVVAAAEVTVGLGIVVAVFRRRASTSVDELSEMKG